MLREAQGAASGNRAAEPDSRALPAPVADCLIRGIGCYLLQALRGREHVKRGKADGRSGDESILSLLLYDKQSKCHQVLIRAYPLNADFDGEHPRPLAV